MRSLARIFTTLPALFLALTACEQSQQDTAGEQMEMAMALDRAQLQEAIETIVNCWSCDNVPNDLDNKPITTLTTLNIPKGIYFYHTVPIKATQKTYPGEWIEFNITVTDIVNESHNIYVIKDPASSPCLDDVWDRVKETADAPMRSRLEPDLYLPPFTFQEVNDYLKEAMRIFWDENNLNVSLKSQPVKNKANKELISLLRRKIKVPNTDITIHSGLKKRDKVIQIVFNEKLISQQSLLDRLFKP